MLAKLFDKLRTLADHHQIMFTLIVGFSIISCSWGVEKILETYFFPKKPLAGYLVAILLGLGLLWITKHFILHEL